MPGTTHVLTITDMSGSMSPLADDVRGGFNSYVAGLREDDGKYRLTATVFDNEFISLCVNAKLGKVPELTVQNYMPRGMTALRDAVGKTVAEFRSRVPVLDDGDRVLVVIQTDGHENASREYTWEQIKTLIKELEATGRWSFVYLGAGVDTWAQAEQMGVAGSHYINTAATSMVTRSAYDGLTQASMAYSRGASGAEVSCIVAATPGATEV